MFRLEFGYCCWIISVTLFVDVFYYGSFCVLMYRCCLTGDLVWWN